MNTSKPSDQMRRRMGWGAAGILILASLLPTALAQSTPAPSQGVASPVGPAQAASPVAGAEGQRADTTVADQHPALSPSVTDILRMARAGVSKEVIKSFVESSTVIGQLSATDVIALKEQGIADDITTALLKRIAEGRTQAAGTAAEATGNGAGSPAPAPNYAPRASLDPESYDYFRHYYLHPRALASVYQRLGPYRPPFGYGYGYGPRPVFGSNYPFGY